MKINPGYPKIILAVFIWSSWGLLIPWLGLPGPLISFATNLFAWCFLCLFLGIKAEELAPRRVGKKNLALFLLIGAMVNLNNVTYFQALKLTSVANAVFSHYFAPVLVFLLAPFLLREKIEGRAFLSLLLSIAGLYLVIHTPGLRIAGRDWQGIGFGLSSALSYALIIILFRSLAPGLSAFVLAWYSCLASCLLIFPLVLPLVGVIFKPFPFIALIVIGITHAALAPMLYISGLKTVPAHHAGILSYLEPIGGVLLAAFFLSQTLKATVIIGGLLICGAGYLLVKSRD